MDQGIMKIIGIVCVAVAAAFGGAGPLLSGSGDGVAIIAAGQPYSGTLLLISGGLLFIVRRRKR